MGPSCDTRHDTSSTVCGIEVVFSSNPSSLEMPPIHSKVKLFLGVLIFLDLPNSKRLIVLSKKQNKKKSKAKIVRCKGMFTRRLLACFWARFAY